MLGRNHIRAGIASIVILSTGTLALSQQSSDKPLGVFAPMAKQCIQYLTTDGSISLPKTGMICTIPYTQIHLNFDVYLFIIICALFYIIGTVLPDIDSPESLLGRHIHINLQHRTWTHAIYMVLIFGLLGIWFRPLMWASIAYAIHLGWDSLSYGGNCWFYPFSKYIDYSSGAHVKRKHIFKLYRVGSISEYIIVIIVIICAIISIYFGITKGIYSHSLMG